MASASMSCLSHLDKGFDVRDFGPPSNGFAAVAVYAGVIRRTLSGEGGCRAGTFKDDVWRTKLFRAELAPVADHKISFPSLDGETSNGVPGSVE